MKHSFKIALKIYKYLCILFTFSYWIYIIIEDYYFIENYWNSNKLMYMVIWTRYFLIYFIIFTFLYWITSAVIITLYHKLVKVKNKKS